MVNVESPPLIVNLFGGPGSGKSTQAAGLFYKLKVAGINCELVTEKAKDLTWEENIIALSNQMYVTGNQLYRQQRVENKVDIVITDSPVLLGIYYWPKHSPEVDEAYKNLLVGIFKSKNNYNVMLNRPDKYNPIGRSQTHNEAKQVDTFITSLLEECGLDYDSHHSTPEGLDVLYKTVLFEYKSRQEAFNEKHGTP